MLSGYHQNVLRMRHKEEETLAVNDETSWRILYVSLFNIVLTIVYGGWQMFSIKTYFRAKKII